MWTGIVSLEGGEYYMLAPLSVLTFVGVPLLLLQNLLTALLAAPQ